MLSWRARQERKEEQARQRLILESRFGVPDKVARKWHDLYPFEDVMRWCEALHAEGGRWVEIDYSTNCSGQHLQDYYYLLYPVSARLEYRSWSF